jgi:alanyl-tRNA synthetase
MKVLRKQKYDALDELLELTAAAALHSEPEIKGRKLIVRVFTDRDIGFAKLFAQKVTHTAAPAIALVASTVNPPGVVFAQTPPLASSSSNSSQDMGVMLNQILSSVGGRGGGTRDFAQGGVPPGCNVEQLLQLAADTIKA